MFSRIMNVIKGMLNKGISKVETPEILAEQAQMELESSVKQLKEALISAVTAEKALEQKIKKDSEDLATWQKRAELAVSKGDDALAKECLKKRQEIGGTLENLKTQLEGQKQATAGLRDKLAEQEEKLRKFQTQKKDLIARHQASSATAKAQEILSTGSGSGGSAMDKIEEKIRQKELMNEARAEVSGMKEKALEDKVKELEVSSDLDMELLALKEKMAAPEPKLIQMTESAPEDVLLVEEVKPDEK